MKSKFKVGDLCKSSGYKFINNEFYFIITKVYKASYDDYNIWYHIKLLNKQFADENREFKKFTEGSQVGTKTILIS